MTDDELLVKVKAGMGISGSALDAKLLMHVKAAKGLMANYDVATEEIESDLGIQCLTAGVQDLLNPVPGGMNFSPATLMILQQLHHVSLEEVE